MAEVIIRLVVDPTTGKKNVVIGYRSDADAMPIEHEDAHKEIVDRLIEGGALAASELGEIIVEREPDTGIPAEEPGSETEPIGGALPLPEES